MGCKIHCLSTIALSVSQSVVFSSIVRNIKKMETIFFWLYKPDFIFASKLGLVNNKERDKKKHVNLGTN